MSGTADYRAPLRSQVLAFLRSDGLDEARALRLNEVEPVPATTRGRASLVIPGVEGWLLMTRSEGQRLALGDAVSDVEHAAACLGLSHCAVVLPRRGHDVADAFAVTTLATISDLLHRLRSHQPARTS